MKKVRTFLPRAINPSGRLVAFIRDMVDINRHRRKIRTIQFFMSKEKSVIAKIRGEKVNAAEIYLNIKKKENQLNKIMRKYKVKSDEIAYIGDDVNDIGIMTQVGISFTPLDANDKVKNIADKICSCKGGDGVFREVTDFLLSFHEN